MVRSGHERTERDQARTVRHVPEDRRRVRSKPQRHLVLPVRVDRLWWHPRPLHLRCVLLMSVNVQQTSAALGSPVSVSRRSEGVRRADDLSGYALPMGQGLRQNEEAT